MAMKPRSAIKTDLFADEHHRKKIDSLGDPRAESESHIDFAAPAADVDRVAPRPASARGGRPPYPTETMVRILGLKRRYTLSDEQMEYPLLDRMSYKRFCGLAPATNIPDRTTAWTFENRIGEAGAKALIEQGAMPDDWQPAKRRQKDIEATWTKEPLWLQTVAQRRQEAQVHPHDRDRPGQHPRQPTLRRPPHEPGCPCGPRLPVGGARSLVAGQRVPQPNSKERPAQQATVGMPAAAQQAHRQDASPSRTRVRGHRAVRWQADSHHRPGAGELRHDPDGGRLPPEAARLRPGGRNRGLLTPAIGPIAVARGDSRQERGDTAGKGGAWPEKLNPIRSRSSLLGGIYRKPRVIRDAQY